MITQESISQFDRDGFLVLPVTIPSPVLDGALADIALRFSSESGSIPGVPHYPNRIQDAWRLSNNVKAIATCPTIVETLEQLYSRKALPFQTLNFKYGTEQKIHSDTIHFNSEPRGFMCGVWVALEDVEADQGPLVYYPGSHKRPELTLLDLDPRVRRLQRRSRILDGLCAKVNQLANRKLFPEHNIYSEIYEPYYEPHIGQLIESEKLIPAFGTIKKGQAIVWSANLLHGGAPHHNRGKTRFSQVTHYFFEGCSYHTPLLETRSLLSNRRSIHWRKPVWIE